MENIIVNTFVIIVIQIIIIQICNRYDIKYFFVQNSKDMIFKSVNGMYTKTLSYTRPLEVVTV